MLAYEIEKNDLRKELYLSKNKAYNLRNFSTFAAILKICHPQCIEIVVRTPPDFDGSTPEPAISSSDTGQRIPCMTAVN